MLQEVARWPEDPTIEGWKVFHGAGSAAAVLVPAELAHDVRFCCNSDLTSSVLIGELGVMSAYFADSSKPMEDFERSMMIVRLEL